jgi:polyisoprenoid-binding protein YceI
MVKMLLSAWLLLAPLSAHAAEALTWSLTPEASSIRWIATQNNAPLEGHFENFTAEIRFHPDAVATSYAKVTIDTASITTSYDEAQSTLKTKDWFFTDSFPHAVFEATRFEALPEENRFRATGTLSIRDQKQPITLDFLMHHMNDEEAHIIGETIIKRTDFGIGWAETAQVADEVTVKIEIKASR